MAEVLPLYVLLSVMRQRWDAGDIEGAVALAKVAAPYLHGKAPLARPGGDLALVSDEELERAGWGGDEADGECGGGGEAVAAPGEEGAG